MDKKELKIITVVGTRPEIIRLSEVIKKLDRYVNHVLVHTGQNYDYELNEIFFKDLELRKPDYFMEVDRSSLGATVGDIIRKSELIFKKESPDALIILGDTNSSLSAYMAKRMHIPIFHMEAGNRCFDFNVPEETNRRIIDHIADINLVYTEHARRHLLSEGLPHRHIYLTGSPMNEVLSKYRSKIEASTILTELKLKKDGYFLVSVHREENVDHPENFKSIIGMLNQLAEIYHLPLIVSTHPRTKKRIRQLKEKKMNPLIQFLKPFGFLDYNWLQMNARCVLSDSGTISEESAILNFPAITIRNAMERPEAMDHGTIILTGLTAEIVVDSVRFVLDEFNEVKKYHKICPEYEIENTSMRVLKLVFGVSKLINKWSGIER